MKKKFIIFLFILVLFTILQSIAQTHVPVTFGLWHGNDNPPIDPSSLSYGLNGYLVKVNWRDIEQTKDNFSFTALDAAIEQRLAKDKSVIVLIWPRQSNNLNGGPPAWLFNSTQNGGANIKYVWEPDDNCIQPPNCVHKAPYYPDPAYQNRFQIMIQKVAEHIISKQATWKLNYDGFGVIAVQACMGVTGDYDLYKNQTEPDWNWNGNPSFGDKVEFELFKTFASYFNNAYLNTGIYALYNRQIDGQAQSNWLKNTSGFTPYWVKSPGWEQSYQLPDDNPRLAWLLPASFNKRQNEYIRSRAEMSKDILTAGWWQIHPYRNMFESLSYGLHIGLDIANFPGDIISDGNNADAFNFYNRHAGKKDPASAKYAFSSLRDGLDAADGTRFPPQSDEVDNMGNIKRGYIDRYIRIANMFSQKGAAIRLAPGENQNHVTGGPIPVSDASNINDVGWDILRDNYERYLTEVYPNLDITGDGIADNPKPYQIYNGYWNIDAPTQPNSIFGRYAKGIEDKPGKRCLYFQVADAFLQGYTGNLNITVWYLNKGGNTWFFKYKDLSGTSVSRPATKGNNNIWKSASFIADAAIFENRNAASGPSDFLLQTGSTNGTSNEEDVFVLIEVEKVNSSGLMTAKTNSSATSNNNNNIAIYPNPTSERFTITTTDKKPMSSVGIYNQFGRLVIQKKVNNSSVTILRSEIGNMQGLYFILVTSNGRVYKRELKAL